VILMFIRSDAVRAFIPWRVAESSSSIMESLWVGALTHRRIQCRVRALLHR
jgi:hypothetical protein